VPILSPGVTCEPSTHCGSVVLVKVLPYKETRGGAVGPTGTSLQATFQFGLAIMYPGFPQK
jgi:hypothetical protein